jgi:hypothetical protein
LDAVDDRVDDPRGPVDDVERRVEVVLGLSSLGDRAGSSSVTHPVSTLFMWMPSAMVVGADVRVIMLSAALAMLVCGWRVVLNASVELPLDGRHVDDVLVAPGVRSISGFSRALSTNGATALTSWVSSSSTDETSCEQQAPRVALAQVDLLQVLVEPPLGEQTTRVLRPRARRQQQRRLRQLCRVSPTGAGSAIATVAIAGCDTDPARCAGRVLPGVRLHQVVARRPSYGPTRRSTSGGIVASAAVSTPSCAGRSRAGGAPSGRRCSR